MLFLRLNFPLLLRGVGPLQPQDAITDQLYCQGTSIIKTQNIHEELKLILNFRKVAQEKCRKVPAVDCFYVLKTVPDVECAPESYEDCIDVVKEVLARGK